MVVGMEALFCAAPIKSLLKPPLKLALPSNDGYDLFESICMLLYISPFMLLYSCCCLCSLPARSLPIVPLRSLPMALRDGFGALTVCLNTSDAMDDDDDDDADVPLLGIGAGGAGGGGCGG